MNRWPLAGSRASAFMAAAVVVEVVPCAASASAPKSIMIGRYTGGGADVLTMQYVDMYSTGASIAFVFDALCLAPLGYLVIRSGFLPKVLGFALIVGCASYLVGFVFVDLLAPHAPEGVDFLFGAVGGLSELAMVAWLLMKGVRPPVPGAPALATASDVEP